MKKKMKPLALVLMMVIFATLFAFGVAADTPSVTVASVTSNGNCPEIYISSEELVFCVDKTKDAPKEGQKYEIVSSNELEELLKPLAGLYFMNEYEPGAKGQAVWSIINASDMSKYIVRLMGETIGEDYIEIMSTYKDVDLSGLDIRVEIYEPVNNEDVQRIARFVVNKKVPIKSPAPVKPPVPEKEPETIIPPVTDEKIEVEKVEEKAEEKVEEKIQEETVSEKEETEEIVEKETTIINEEKEEKEPEIIDEPEVQGFFEAPKTGDGTSNSTRVIPVIMVVALVVFALCLFYMKKSNKNEK